YAFEVLCGLVGAQLASDNFQGMSIRWLDTVDACLDELGAPTGLRTEALMDGYTPGFPVPEDFPGTGRWPPDLIATGNTWFDGVDVPEAVEDQSVVAALREVEGWLGRCGDGEMLVGFLY